VGFERSVVQPSEIWARPDPKLLQRPKRGIVEFYVRPAVSEARADLIDALNTAFIQDIGAAFRPPGQSLTETWHRVDQVTRKWAGLELDREALHGLEYEHAVQLPGGAWIGRRNLEADPPTYQDYPDAWHDMIDVRDEVTAISALSHGADDYWREREDLQQRAMTLVGAARPD
jgi:hypothetical protein